MSDMSGVVIRSVGSAAQHNTSRHSLGLYWCVVNTAQYTVSLPVDQQGAIKITIENALAAVVMQHGILRVGTANEDTREPAFVYLRSIDLRQMIEWKAISGSSPDAYMQGLLRATESQHDKLWEDLPRKPGWKLIVHQSCRDDMAEDGQSAFIFHRDLLRALNSSASAPEALQDHVLLLTKPPILPAGSEVLVPFTTSWGYMLRLIWSEVIWKSFVPSWMKSKPDPSTIPWTGNPINPEPHKANFRLVRVPHEVLTSLLTACRERRVTLTPLFHALVLASVSSRLPADVAPAFSMQTTISLRRFTKPEFDRENSLHSLVTSHTYLADASAVSALGTSIPKKQAGGPEVAEPLIWSTAAKIGADLHARVNALPKDDIAGLTGMVSDWRQRWIDQFGKNRDNTWEVSNAGSIKARDAKGPEGQEGYTWQIERSIFSQGATPVGSAFGLNVAGVEGQGLWMTVNWQETAVETSLMEGMAEDLQNWMDIFGNTGGSGVIDGEVKRDY